MSERILVISDSHGRNENVWKVLDKTKPIDRLFHLGDLCGSCERLRDNAGCPTEVVAGNNDYLSGLPKELVTTVGSHRILLIHGHRLIYGGAEELKRAAWLREAEGIIFGHTHQPFLDRRGDIWAANPGSISLPRQEGHRPSYLILENDDRDELHFTQCFL